MFAVNEQLSLLGNEKPPAVTSTGGFRRSGGAGLSQGLQAHSITRPRRSAEIPQTTLPGEFEPPPPECKVSRRDHFFHAIPSYTAVHYWPVSAYESFCLYCSLPESNYAKH